MKQQAIRVSVVVFLGTFALAGCSTASIENPAETEAGGNGPGGSGGSRGSGGAGGAFVVLPPDAGRSPDDAGCGDGCKVVVPYCGDGIINQTSEVCDDGNAKGGDGCTAACDQIEDGWVCPNQGQACLKIWV